MTKQAFTTTICLVAMCWSLRTFSGHAAPLDNTAADVAAPAHAAASRLAKLQIGIEGAYKLGQWVPLQIQFKPGVLQESDSIYLISPDAEGIPVTYDQQRIPKSNIGSLEKSFLVRIGQSKPWLEVECRNKDKVLWRESVPASQLPAPIASGSQLIYNLGTETPLHAAIGIRSPGSRDRAITKHVVDPANLPTHWLGYSSADVILLATNSESWNAGVDAIRWQTLRNWVELGGNLIVSGGGLSARLFQDDGPLQWAACGRVEGAISMRQTTGIEQFAGASRRLDRSSPGSGSFQFDMLALREPRGLVEAWEGLANQRMPAIIRSTVGLGRVTIVTFAIDLEPFLSWADRPRLLSRLLDYGLDEPLDEELFGSDAGPVTHLGFTDIVGQLRHALDQFNGVKFVSFSWIAALAVFYLLWIGPLDYWILRRFQKPEWTWITLLLAVIGFTGIASHLAWRWKGNDFRVNQLSIVDIDSTTSIVRGTSWSHLYSPTTRQLQITIQPADLIRFQEPPQHIVTWQGLPGQGFGGLERSDGGRIFSDAYQLNLRTESPDRAAGDIQHFPIAVWSSRSLLGQWWGRAKLDTTSSNLDVGPESLISGSVDNPLAVDLRDAVLIFDRWAYPLGTLTANEQRAVMESSAVDLQTLLTQRRIVEGRNVVTPWNQQTTDISRIVEMLLFYGAAKGQAYTRLQHRYQRFVDWSDHVRLSQAVLWGRAAQPASRLKILNQPSSPTQDWTYCRILVPVKGRGSIQP